MVIDYNEGQEAINSVGTDENAQVKMMQSAVLMDKGHPKEAIDLLLKTIEENPKNIEPQLKLAQFYIIQCKEVQEHCEDALWQINVILKIDSSNVNAKQLLKELKLITEPKINNQYKE